MVHGASGNYREPTQPPCRRVTAHPAGGYDNDPTFKSLSNQVQMAMWAYQNSPDDLTGAALAQAIGQLANYLGIAEGSPGTPPPNDSANSQAYAIYELLTASPGPCVGTASSLADLSLGSSIYAAVDAFNHTPGLFSRSSPFYNAINATGNSTNDNQNSDVESAIQNLLSLISKYQNLPSNASPLTKQLLTTQIANDMSELAGMLAGGVAGNPKEGPATDGFLTAISLFLVGASTSRSSGTSLLAIANNYIVNPSKANLANLEKALDSGALTDLQSILANACKWEGWST